MTGRLRRIAFFIIAVPMLLLGITLVGGAGIFTAVELADRFSTTARWLREIRTAGGLEVGTVILIVVAISSVIFALSDPAKHWPFKKWAKEAGPERLDVRKSPTPTHGTSTERPIQVGNI